MTWLESQGEKIRDEGLFIIAEGDDGEGKVEYVFDTCSLLAYR
jgi:hypothetical protein